ncbi:hypothetical protein JCM17960_02660 [Magnetospira thiophila]
MKRQKSSFRHESLQNQESVQALLKALTEGIAKGKVTFSDADDQIQMQPEGLLNLQLTASQEDNRNRIQIRLTWENHTERSLKTKPLMVKVK